MTSPPKPLDVDVCGMNLFHSCSKNSIPCRTVVAMATERKKLKNFLLNHKGLDILLETLCGGLL